MADSKMQTCSFVSQFVVRCIEIKGMTKCKTKEHFSILQSANKNTKMSSHGKDMNQLLLQREESDMECEDELLQQTDLLAIENERRQQQQAQQRQNNKWNGYLQEGKLSTTQKTPMKSVRKLKFHKFTAVLNEEFCIDIQKIEC